MSVRAELQVEYLQSHIDVKVWLIRRDGRDIPVSRVHEKAERLKSKWIHPSISPAPRLWIVCPCVFLCIYLCVCKYNRIIDNHSCRSLRLEPPIPPPASKSCPHTLTHTVMANMIRLHTRPLTSAPEMVTFAQPQIQNRRG